MTATAKTRAKALKQGNLSSFFFFLTFECLSFILTHSLLGRNNVGTHPTTSTQTRSTSRPHVFHSHGVGLGQGLCADPFLPCNSHHLRRTPTTSGNASRQSTTSRNQAGPQASASSSAANSTTNASSTPWIVDGDSYLGDLRDGLGNRRFRPHRKNYTLLSIHSWF